MATYSSVLPPRSYVLRNLWSSVSVSLCTLALGSPLLNQALQCGTQAIVSVWDKCEQKGRGGEVATIGIWEPPDMASSHFPLYLSLFLPTFSL